MGQNMKGLVSMVQKILRSFFTKMLFVLFVVSFANALVIWAETPEKVDREDILAMGAGKIVDGNVAHARKIAISIALAKGVEEYLARRLGKQGMVNNFRKLIQEVIPRARETIENFHILAEEQIDKDYQVLVRLKVNEEMMEEELRSVGLILREGPPIKILFLVSQIEKQRDCAPPLSSTGSRRCVPPPTNPTHPPAQYDREPRPAQKR